MDENASAHNNIINGHFVPELREAQQVQNNEDPDLDFWVDGFDPAPVRPEAPQPEGGDDSDQESQNSAQIEREIQSFREYVERNVV